MLFVPYCNVTVDVTGELIANVHEVMLANGSVNLCILESNFTITCCILHVGDS